MNGDQILLQFRWLPIKLKENPMELSATKSGKIILKTNHCVIPPIDLQRNSVLSNIAKTNVHSHLVIYITEVPVC